MRIKSKEKSSIRFFTFIMIYFKSRQIKNNKVYIKISRTLIIFCVICLTSQFTVYATKESPQTTDISSSSEDKAFLSEYMQYIYNDESGLAINEVNDVIQTSDGYIWIASYNGLTRYDGKNFVVYNSSTSKDFHSDSVRCLLEGKDGKLWIGTNDNGVILYDNGRFSTVEKAKENHLSNSIRTITEDTLGTIYVGSTDGIEFITKENKLKQIPLPQISSALNMTCDKNNQIWGVSNEGDVFVLDNKRLKHNFPNGSFDNSVCLSISQAPNGNMLVGTTENKVIEISVNNGKYSFEKKDTNTKHYINNIYVDKEKRIWISSDSGIGYFDTNMHNFHSVDGLLMDNSVESILEDYEGNLWLTSSRQGLLKMSKSKFKDINFSANLPKSVVNSTKLFEGNLYIATDDGLTILDKNNKSVKNALVSMLDKVRIRNLYIDSKNNLWLSTYGNYGVIKYKSDGTYQNFTTQNSSLTSEKVRSVLERKDGSIVVATSDGLNIIKDNKLIKTYTKKDGLINSSILSLYEDKDGVIYAGSDGNGIYTIKDNEIVNYSEKDGLSSGVILRMTYDNKLNGVWISTGNKLNFWDKDGIRAIQKLKDTDGNIFDIKVLNKDEILLLTAKSIYLCSSENLIDDKPLKIKKLSKKDGMKSTITANSWNDLTDDGMIYLCCNEGVVSINLDNIYRNTKTPKLAINSITVDKKVYKNTNNLTINPDSKRIIIDFAVLSFSDTQNNTVTYHLDGFDENPITLLSQDLNNVTYTNLKGGKYQFHFSGKNNDGIKSNDESILTINKELSFIEKPLVQLGIIILVFAIIFFIMWAIFKIRTKNLLRRQERYKKITTQCITAIANTIDAKDKYTNGHSRRVANYCVEIAKKMNMSQDEIDSLYFTALLHDIGKIGIPDEILKKPSKLTSEEYSIIKQHPYIGSEILKEIDVIKDIAKAARYHHERYDGAGYNDCLKGDEIPLIARIVCVADSFDAMASKRCYRNQLTMDKIIKELERCKGTQFDPEITDIFLALIKNGTINID